MLEIPRFASLPTGDGLADRETGLVWEARPRPEALIWRDAVARVNGAGWRLPSASELMALLTAPSLDLLHEGLAPGVSFWSASQSPFASSEQVRVILRDATGRWAVALRAKTEVARLWRVRALDPAELTDGAATATSTQAGPTK